jgi:hypothetical protein
VQAPPTPDKLWLPLVASAASGLVRGQLPRYPNLHGELLSCSPQNPGGLFGCAVGGEEDAPQQIDLNQGLESGVQRNGNFRQSVR